MHFNNHADDLVEEKKYRYWQKLCFS